MAKIGDKVTIRVWDNLIDTLFTPDSANYEDIQGEVVDVQGAAVYVKDGNGEVHCNLDKAFTIIWEA